MSYDTEQLIKEIALRSWIACANVYGVKISEQMASILFEKWWKNNSASVIKSVGHGFYDRVRGSSNG